jgi:L-Ala-D/L-Glu epimerase
VTARDTIRDLRTHRIRAPLHSPFVTALRTTTAVDSLLVEVVDADGRSGWGEGAPVWRITGDSVEGMLAAVHGPLRAVVVGRDPDDYDAVCADLARAVVGNTTAKAAVDIALHDLAARRRGIPLPALFGSATLRLPTDVTLAAAPTDQMVEAAAKRVAEGFGVLKLKVGEGGVDELARLRAIRAAVGPDVLIRLDANQGWTPRQAVRVIGAMEDAGLDIELVEQPVPARDLDGLTWVTDHTRTPILADEAVWSPRDLLEVVRRRAADMVNPKLAKCGGLRAGRQLLAVAEAAGVGVMLGSMMETHVGVAATAVLATLAPGPLTHDLDAAWWLVGSPVLGGMSYDGATVVLPDAPGLGVDGVRPAALVDSVEVVER